jgi:hypothetical protein
VKFNVNLVNFYPKGYEGDPRWILEVATTYPSVSGTAIAPCYVDVIGPDENIDDLISEGVSNLASQIDWGPFIKDLDDPYVSSFLPVDTNTVPIESNVYLDLKDSMPSAGMDLSEIKVIINNGVEDFDITSDCIIEGDPLYYKIKWKPPIREYRRE